MNLLYRFFLIWYVCGVFLLSFDLLPSWLEWANAVFLMLAGTLGVIYFYHSYGKRAGTVISLIIFIVSMTSEYMGATYGLIFGKYTYTSDFGLQILGVPITIGFAWLMVMATSHAFLQTLRLPAPLAVIYGGLIAVLMDLVIDPVAYLAKSYWIWEQHGPYYNIPTQNFFGWFFVAAVLHLFLLLYGERRDNVVWHKRIIVLYILIIFMFLLLALLAQLYVAVFVTTLGSVLLFIHYKQRSVA